MNKKGLTLVEIIVSIGLISIVMVFLFQIIMTIKNANDRQNEKTDVLITTTIITREVEKDLESFGLDKDENTNLPEKPTKCELTNIENTRNNIIPNTATNIKCLKITYDDSKVKNNEGYILYYTNDDKHFLAYKRGKGNVIETQTVREISIPPKNDFAIELVNYDENQGKGYSLKITMEIQNDNIKSDLNINYAVSVSHKITIINEDGYLKNKELELIRQTGEKNESEEKKIHIELEFNDYLYEIKSVSCDKCIGLNDTALKSNETNTVLFTMPDEDVILNISIAERPIELATYLIDIIAKNHSDSNPYADDIGLVTDTTDDKNIRYVGLNPNNYIEFSNSDELWRIIGVFTVTTVDDNGNEKDQQLVKIVRDEPFSSNAWDFDNENNWLKSSLQKYLNDTTGKYYSSLQKENKLLIANVVWKLGGITGVGIDYKTSYKIERNIEGFTGTKNNPETWEGKIGLIYPSDYGYASTASNCLDSKLSDNKCYDQNWLFKKYNNSNKINYWTITHYSNKNNAKNVLYIDQSNKKINQKESKNRSLYVYPSLYLKADTKILRRGGTKTNPHLTYLEDNE